MRHLILIAAMLALAACEDPLRPEEPGDRVLACYRDGKTTIRVQHGTTIQMRAIEGPDKQLIEHWAIRLGPREWYHHTAEPDEVCGPER